MSVDPASRYEQALNGPSWRLSEVSEGEAIETARVVFAEAQIAEQAERDLTTARDRLEGAREPPKQWRQRTRLEALRERDPGAAMQADDDFAWLGHSVVGFAQWPFHEQVRHWLDITGADRASAGIKSRRGSGRTWPGLEAAAWFLLDWHTAARHSLAAPGWLAKALTAIDHKLERPDAGGVDRAHKLALTFRRSWKARK